MRRCAQRETTPHDSGNDQAKSDNCCRSRLYASRCVSSLVLVAFLLPTSSTLRTLAFSDTERVQQHNTSSANRQYWRQLPSQSNFMLAHLRTTTALPNFPVAHLSHTSFHELCFYPFRFCLKHCLWLCKLAKNKSFAATIL